MTGVDQSCLLQLLQFSCLLDFNHLASSMRRQAQEREVISKGFRG